MNAVLTVILLLLSSKGTWLYGSNPSWFVIMFLFIAVGFKTKRFTYRDLSYIGYFSLTYLCIMTFRYMFLNSLPVRYLLTDIIFFTKYIFVSYLYVALLKDKAMYYIGKYIAIGALISIPLYFLQLFAGGLLLNIGSKLPFGPDIEGYVSFIVFTFVDGHSIRNCGFAWEPGAFGCFLNIGLLLNFVHNDFKIDKRCIWIIIAIFTTLSTTTYFSMLIVMLIYYRVNGGKFGKLLFIAVPSLAILSTQLPFLVGKIIDIYKHDMEDIQNIAYLSDFYKEEGSELPLNRFSSIVYLYQLFGIQLLWGVSNPYQDTVEILKNVNISNGIVDFCAKFGVLGLSYNLYQYGKFFYVYLKKIEYVIYSIVLLLMLSFGEPILILPIVLIFYFINQYVKEPVYKDDIETENLKLA